MKRRDLIALVLAIVVILVGGTLLVKTRLVTSKAQLANQVTTAVEKQDSKLFLKQFDKESKVSRFADLGAKSVLKDWKKHATISPEEIGQRVVADKSISGADNDYRFFVQKKTRFLFFKSYYLRAGLTRLKPDQNSKDGKIKVNGQTVQLSDFDDGFFPGIYDFVTKLKINGIKYSNDYDYSLTGNSATFAFDFEFDDDSNDSDTNYDDSADDEDSDSTDKAYATMNDSEYESKADEIGDALDKTYGEEQSTYSSYDDSQYPDYQGNTK
ncbi:hypothetical protein [Secundilactobacillus similis]|uniref:Uncharacterized protein n=1 Tax=Secundilactobacillus similis DSM 23365 = JCM 2765 TaxID=1423804 RepID=A0A0R2FE36_9LACO|nr:hypothetical protein [Secundilactobacillus similis]KRN26809.1 hypothetical protein FD14_GL000041 [Secundilactobacillus similis DSM 23365 = JCM 2765]